MIEPNNNILIMPPLRLPIGIQSFEKIRTGGYAYIDKTPYIASLLERGSYFFLSRPRRFGKSLFLDTLDSAFSGKRELFSGLYLDTPESGWDWSRRYPVIRISLGQRINRTTGELREYISYILTSEAEKYGFTNDTSLSSGFQLNALIKNLYKKTGEPVVVLIDEYDKPILDNIEVPVVSTQLRDELKSFYGSLKDLDPYIRFTFLTGVSKFAKAGIFSDLNNLNDITIDHENSAICGYTQADLETVFADRLLDFNKEVIREWYNGYSWTGETVYNPFDILLLFDKRAFRPYWFETGTPTFLIKLWQSKPRLPAEYDGMTAGDELLGSFDPESLRPETLLFQAGYLTIKEWSSDPIRGFRYVLGYPNIEVRTSLNHLFSQALSGGDVSENRDRLYNLLERGDASGMRSLFHSFFASIPHDWYRKNQISGFEGYYASVVYAYFGSLGYEVIPEDTTNKGRIDLTVKTRKAIWIFEFKVRGIDTTGEKNPLAQLRERGYAEKYRSDPRTKYEIGIVFDPETRNIERWEM
jgi:hypothetical protein